jgi:hypothetical protein
MRHLSLGLAVVLALGLVVPTTAQEKADDGFVSIFDGKSLEGWNGRTNFWSVEDGAITGTTTAEKPTSGNTFIIWEEGQLGDFELTLKFKIEGGNSGIQYRSKQAGDWVIGGYQADFDGANGWTGTLYEERGRGVLAKRGNKVVITPEGEKKTVGTTTPEKEIVEAVKEGEWNEYRIVAKGNHLQHYVNGKLTIDVVDNQSDKAAEKGLLALQLHAGPPMKVQFKDIKVKGADRK